MSGGTKTAKTHGFLMALTIGVLMKKTNVALALTAAFAARAIAAHDKTVTKTPTRTTETTTDTTHNPLTGTDTTTKETVTKDAQGKETSKMKTKTKRDHKSGKLKKKSVESETKETH
jgi:hypothetical protein